jgi:hypothetical protein
MGESSKTLFVAAPAPIVDPDATVRSHFARPSLERAHRARHDATSDPLPRCRRSR